MILYHFTAIEHLDGIFRDGLVRGDVPLSATDGQQAVWFTTDAGGLGHGLSEARSFTDEEVAALKASGIKLPAGQTPRFLDKRRVRIKVVISSRDRKLLEWLPFARKHLEKDWRDTLHSVASGTEKARTWWIYRGVISPDAFAEVCLRREDGAYSAITAADRAELVPSA